MLPRFVPIQSLPSKGLEGDTLNVVHRVSRSAEVSRRESSWDGIGVVRQSHLARTPGSPLSTALPPFWMHHRGVAVCFCYDCSSKLPQTWWRTTTHHCILWRAEVQNQFHWAETKVPGGPHTPSGGSRGEPFSRLFQLQQASDSPWQGPTSPQSLPPWSHYLLLCCQMSLPLPLSYKDARLYLEPTCITQDNTPISRSLINSHLQSPNYYIR